MKSQLVNFEIAISHATDFRTTKLQTFRVSSLTPILCSLSVLVLRVNGKGKEIQESFFNDTV